MPCEGNFVNNSGGFRCHIQHTSDRQKHWPDP
jgi:hypothetical protein